MDAVSTHPICAAVCSGVLPRLSGWETQLGNRDAMMVEREIFRVHMDLDRTFSPCISEADGSAPASKRSIATCSVPCAAARYSSERPYESTECTLAPCDIRRRTISTS